MIPVKKKYSNHSKTTYYLKIMVAIAFFACLFPVLARALDENASETTKTYTITLPTATAESDGSLIVEDIQYIVDDNMGGSTKGVEPITLNEGSKISFLIKFADNPNYVAAEGETPEPNYLKNITIASNKNDMLPLTLYVYDYDNNGHIITRKVRDNEIINPKQTYITSARTVMRSEAFTVEGLKKLNYNISIKLDGTDEITLNQLMDFEYKIGENGTKQTANYDYESNSVTISSQAYSSDNSDKLYIYPEKKLGIKYNIASIKLDGIETDYSDKEEIEIASLKRNRRITVTAEPIPYSTVNFSLADSSLGNININDVIKIYYKTSETGNWNPATYSNEKLIANDIPVIDEGYETENFYVKWEAKPGYNVTKVGGNVSKNNKGEFSETINGNLTFIIKATKRTDPDKCKIIFPYAYGVDAYAVEFYNASASRLNGSTIEVDKSEGTYKFSFRAYNSQQGSYDECVAITANNTILCFIPSYDVRYDSDTSSNNTPRYERNCLYGDVTIPLTSDYIDSNGNITIQSVTTDEFRQGNIAEYKYNFKLNEKRDSSKVSIEDMAESIEVCYLKPDDKYTPYTPIMDSSFSSPMYRWDKSSSSYWRVTSERYYFRKYSWSDTFTTWSIPRAGLLCFENGIKLRIRFKPEYSQYATKKLSIRNSNGRNSNGDYSYSTTGESYNSDPRCAEFCYKIQSFGVDMYYYPYTRLADFGIYPDSNVSRNTYGITMPETATNSINKKISIKKYDKDEYDENEENYGTNKYTKTVEYGDSMKLILTTNTNNKPLSGATIRTTNGYQLKEETDASGKGTGEYLLPNITSNESLTIERPRKIEFPENQNEGVAFIDEYGNDISSVAKVNNNEELKFRIVKKDGYEYIDENTEKIIKMTKKATDNSTEETQNLKADGTFYTIKADDDYVISTSGLKANFNLRFFAFDKNLKIYDETGTEIESTHSNNSFTFSVGYEGVNMSEYKYSEGDTSNKEKIMAEATNNATVTNGEINQQGRLEFSIGEIKENTDIMIYSTKKSAADIQWCLTKKLKLVQTPEGALDCGLINAKKTDDPKNQETCDIKYRQEGTGVALNNPSIEFSVKGTDYFRLSDGYEIGLYADEKFTKPIDTRLFDKDRFDNETDYAGIVAKKEIEDSGEKNHIYSVSMINNGDKTIEFAGVQFENSDILTEEILNKDGTNNIGTVKYIYPEIYVQIKPKEKTNYTIHFQDDKGKSLFEDKSITINEVTEANPKEYGNSSETSPKYYSLTLGEKIEEDRMVSYTGEKRDFAFAINFAIGTQFSDVIISQDPANLDTDASNSTIIDAMRYNTQDTGNVVAYKISNVCTTKDVYVIVKDLGRAPLTVSFNSNSILGVNLFQETEGEMTPMGFGDKATSYGNDFSFLMNSKEGYLDKTVDDLRVYAKTQEYSLKSLIPPMNSTAALTEKDSCDGIFNATFQRVKLNYDGKNQEFIKCSFSNIKSNFSVGIQNSRKSYKIRFEKSDEVMFNDVSNNEITTDQTELYGNSFSFIVKAREGIDISEVKVFKKVPTGEQIDGKDVTIDTEIEQKDGKYTLTNISQDVAVYATNTTKSKKNLTFIPYDGVTYNDPLGNELAEHAKVEYNGNFTFAVSLDNTVSNSNIELHANGVKIPYNSETGLYEIKNIKEDQRITITNLKINQYPLSFMLSDDIIYQNQYGTAKLESDEEANSEKIVKNIVHGESFSFKIAPNSERGIDISDIAVWCKKSTTDKTPIQLHESNGIYTIENIQQPYIIYVNNTKKLQYTVELRTTAGVTCVDEYGNTLSSKITVNHGDNLSFKLAIDNVYSKSSPVVEIKGSTNTLPANTDGSYTLENITENKILEVTGIKKNTYKVTFKEVEGVVYKTIKNKVFTDHLDVEYGDSLQFKITLKDAYDNSTPYVRLNGKEAISGNGGIYSVENINSDIEITVENVKKNAEESAMEEIVKVPTEASSETDVDKVVEATKAYNNLTDEQKELVTNHEELVAAQKSASVVNHTTEGVTVTGIDWNIKLVVTPLNDDKEAMQQLSDTIKRKEMVNLYDIKLYDILGNQKYEVPYGQKVTVTIPCPDISKYENIVIIHENSAGGIEYLSADINANDKTAQFKTSSFSRFGIAGKKIPNFSKEPTDITVSVTDIVKDDGEVKSLLGEGVASQIGELINTEPEKISENSSETDVSQEAKISTEENKNFFERVYNWAINNELLSVIIILILGLLLIMLILIPVFRKKDEK